MQRMELGEHGLVGTLFLPNKSKRLPLIITLGGFRGGLNEQRAKQIALSGRAALALAYFGCGGLPAALQEIPLEYCERAIHWARSHPSIDPERLALWGVSRGAELALLLGGLFPKKIRSIAAMLPSSAVYGSIQTDAPAWIYRGKPLAPSAPLPPLIVDPSLGKTRETAISLTPFFLRGMEDAKAFALAQIPLEKIECPLLLISAGDDRMWPSLIFAERILQRLKEHNSSIPCTHLSYPKAGHSISFGSCTEELHPVAKIWLAYGGSMQENESAKVDSWHQALQFFEKTL